MATRGGMNNIKLDGSDGTDFIHRQKVASQYQISAQNKSRLRSCIFFHFLLFFIMCIKLTPVLLDRLDIFVLEIEELRVPKPIFWEYWWLVSILVAFIGLSSIRKNNLQYMQIYIGATFCNGLSPVLYALVYYSHDVFNYLYTNSTNPNKKVNIQLWQGYPYALLWYIFLTIALQIHSFSIYFASKLVSAWSIQSPSSASNNSNNYNNNVKKQS